LPVIHRCVKFKTFQWWRNVGREVAERERMFLWVAYFLQWLKRYNNWKVAGAIAGSP